MGRQGEWEWGNQLTTLRVPISTLGGFWSATTISETKLEEMPIMVMREMACMARTTVKVAPKAPKFWDAILMDGLGRGGKVECGLEAGC